MDIDATEELWDFLKDFNMYMAKLIDKYHQIYLFPHSLLLICLIFLRLYFSK